MRPRGALALSTVLALALLLSGCRGGDAPAGVAADTSAAGAQAAPRSELAGDPDLGSGVPGTPVQAGATPVANFSHSCDGLTGIGCARQEDEDGE